MRHDMAFPRLLPLLIQRSGRERHNAPNLLPGVWTLQSRHLHLGRVVSFATACQHIRVFELFSDEVTQISPNLQLKLSVT